MRARNLKPGYFANELLGKAEPLIGTLFQGLWCESDREGRLEDRPLRLCGKIFPYRRTVTEKRVDEWLQWLHDHGFIARYMVDGRPYIQVLQFAKHNTPHSKERPSQIPALNGYLHQSQPSQEGDETHTSTVQNSDENALNPESGILNPESSLREIPPTPLGKGGVANAPSDPIPERPRRERRNGHDEPPKIVTHEQRERKDLDELMARREAIGIGGFRDPRPGESASQYRSAQDTEWTLRREGRDRKVPEDLSAGKDRQSWVAP